MAGLLMMAMVSGMAGWIFGRLQSAQGNGIAPSDRIAHHTEQACSALSE